MLRRILSCLKGDMKNTKEKSRFDALGDRMKAYESAETSRKLMPSLPVVVRLDGRSFHTFTKDMPRPFHEPMSRCMIATAKYLVEETKAVIAYTQSDEITLMFYDDNPLQETMFGGRIQKITSVFASLATAKFNQQVALLMPEKHNCLPVFDARVFNVPTLEEAAQCLLFRYIDCIKNSVTMAASAHYHHKELHGVSGAKKHIMLADKGIIWGDYPDFFKEGTFLKRVTQLRSLSEEELSRIPEKYRPTSPTERTSVEEIKLPPFSRIINQVDVIFKGEIPKLAEEFQ